MGNAVDTRPVGGSFTLKSNKGVLKENEESVQSSQHTKGGAGW